jgi:hypothetical protein
MGVASPALANHPVLVEGEADFDGDGVVGLAEDNDGDVVFGTITRALGAAPAIGQNGGVVIVTSGRFVEVVNIMGTGQVTLEAAPGVDVDIEAFIVPADRRIADFPAAQANPFALQAAPGIVINSPNDRYVVIRNVSVINWTDGIRISGDSHVLLDNVRVEHNINNGVAINDNAKVAIFRSSINSTGFRTNPRTGNFPTEMAPMPGAGVNVGATARADINASSITGNFDEGIKRARGSRVDVDHVQLFDNNRNRDIMTNMGMMMPPPAPPAPPTPPAP